MTEPEDKDRWRALAEELGLPPESEATPPPRFAAPRVREAPARQPVESAIEAEPLEPPPVRPQAPPSRGRRRSAPPALEVQAKAPAGEPVSVGEETTEATETPPESAPSEDRPRRGRRRRRSGKPIAGEPEAAGEETSVAESPVSPSANAEEGAEDRPRRRRRRRGKKVEADSETSPVAEVEDVEEEETEVVESREEVVSEEEDEEADEETEDFSTWNVPSWAEIIASLYRPER